MNFKRLSATLLALSMTATTAAFAAGEAVPTSGLLISPNPNAGYDTIITINGEALESYEYTKEIPDSWETETITVQLADIAAVPAGYVPLRAVVQADHGNDPTYKGTDHTREKVPFLAYSPSMKDGGRLPDRDTFAVIGATIAHNFQVDMPDGTIGTSVLEELK